MALILSLYRLATRAAIYRTLRTAGRPPATKAAAVAVDRGDADQCGDSAAVEGAEFRQLGEQGPGGGGADAGNALQQVFLLPPDRAFAHRLVEVGFDAGEFLLQPGEVGVETLRQALVAGLPAAIAFGADHLDDLLAAGNQFTQLAGRLVGNRFRLGADALGEQGDGHRVEAVGLGEPAGSPREVADLPGIDDRQWQAGAGKRRRHG